VLLDPELFEPPEVARTRAPKRSMNAMAGLEQLARQISPILAGYAGND
jgi:hypothetical protein